jgi:hypothetical protein
MGRYGKSWHPNRTISLLFVCVAPRLLFLRRSTPPGPCAVAVCSLFSDSLSVDCEELRMASKLLVFLEQVYRAGAAKVGPSSTREFSRPCCLCVLARCWMSPRRAPVRRDRRRRAGPRSGIFGDDALGHSDSFLPPGSSPRSSAISWIKLWCCCVEQGKWPRLNPERSWAIAKDSSYHVIGSIITNVQYASFHAPNL